MPIEGNLKEIRQRSLDLYVETYVKRSTII